MNRKIIPITTVSKDCADCNKSLTLEGFVHTYCTDKRVRIQRGEDVLPSLCSVTRSSAALCGASGSWWQPIVEELPGYNIGGESRPQTRMNGVPVLPTGRKVDPRVPKHVPVTKPVRKTYEVK